MAGGDAVFIAIFGSGRLFGRQARGPAKKRRMMNPPQVYLKSPSFGMKHKVGRNTNWVLLEQPAIKWSDDVTPLNRGKLLC